MRHNTHILVFVFFLFTAWGACRVVDTPNSHTTLDANSTVPQTTVTQDQTRDPTQAARDPDPDSVEQYMIKQNLRTATDAAKDAGGNSKYAEPYYEVATASDLPSGVDVNSLPQCTTPWKHVENVGKVRIGTNSTRKCVPDDLHELKGVPVHFVRIGKVGYSSQRICLKKTGVIRGPVKITVVNPHPSRCTELAIDGVNKNIKPVEGYLYVDRDSNYVYTPGGYRITLHADELLIRCPGGKSYLKFWNSAVILFDTDGNEVRNGPNVATTISIPVVTNSQANGDVAGVWYDGVSSSTANVYQDHQLEDWQVKAEVGLRTRSEFRLVPNPPTYDPTEVPPQSARLVGNSLRGSRVETRAELAQAGAQSKSKGSYSAHTTFFLPDSTVVFTSSNFVTTGDKPHSQVVQALILNHNKRVLMSNGGESGGVSTLSISDVYRLPPNPHPPFGETVHLGRDGPQLVFQQGAVGNAYWGQDTRFGLSTVPMNS